MEDWRAVGGGGRLEDIDLVRVGGAGPDCIVGGVDVGSTDKRSIKSRRRSRSRSA